MISAARTAEGIGDAVTTDGAISRGDVRSHPIATVRVVSRVEDLEAHAAAWEELSEAALEPNVFYEPWMLLPAIRNLTGARDLHFVLIFLKEVDDPEGRQVLCGLFPLERTRKYRTLPVTALGMWRHEYCFQGTPLLRSDRAREALAAFLDWLSARPLGCSLFEFGHIGMEGPFRRLLDEELQQQSRWWRSSRTFTRALFTPAADSTEYLRAALPRRRRKELKRQARRLGETENLEFLDLEPGGDIERWIADFLALEAKGWKGHGGSAMASTPASSKFFQTVAAEAFRRGRLMMLGLFVDRRPCALKCSFIAGEGSFAFKIAYDETFARFSPGTLLEVETISRLHLRPEIRWMDSCADEDNFMINHLWRDRRTMETVLVSPGAFPGHMSIGIIEMWHRLRGFLPARRSRSTGQNAESFQEKEPS
jgi:CelD/BcsL family acetyltransferase involved in cellulose biosynthesis